LKKNALKRHLHKKRVQKQFQKQAKEAAKKGAKKAGKETVSLAGKAGKAVVNFVKKNPKHDNELRRVADFIAINTQDQDMKKAG